MIRRTLMSPTQLDDLLMNTTVRCVYMHIAEAEDAWSSDPHNHQYHEICYVVRGRGNYYIDGVDYSMEPGDIFLIPRSCDHGETYDPLAPFELRFIMLENMGQCGGDINQIFFTNPKRIRGLPHQTRRLWDQILDEVIERQSGYLSNVESSVKMLYASLYRQIYEPRSRFNKEIQSHKEEGKRVIRDHLLEHIHNYIIGNVSNLDVNGIAKHFHYHPKYLTHLVKNETGKTLTELILSVKLDCARELLAKTLYSISDVIRICGFGNEAYFYRVFKHETEVTPAQYRHKMQNAPQDEVVKY